MMGVVDGPVTQRRITWSRRLGYMLVDDRAVSSVRHTYRQLWHLVDGANPLVGVSTVQTRADAGEPAHSTARGDTGLADRHRRREPDPGMDLLPLRTAGRCTGGPGDPDRDLRPLPHPERTVGGRPQCARQQPAADDRRIRGDDHGRWALGAGDRERLDGVDHPAQLRAAAGAGPTADGPTGDRRSR